MKKTSIQRLVTVLIGVPAVLGVVFFAPAEIAFVFFFAVSFWAAVEFLPLARGFAPQAPLGSLLPLIFLGAGAGFLAIQGALVTQDLGFWLVLAAGLLAALAACTTLLVGTDVRDGLVGIGILAFAIPYFATAPVLLYWLQSRDSRLVLAVLLIVWSGDSVAYLVGSRFGRRKMAPVISPNKTWEGATAGLLAALTAATIWSLARLGDLDLGWLLVAAATSVAAQIGDLVESLIKRGVGVKDSSTILPGHGGFYDRLDAMFMATPVFTVGVALLGLDSVTPV